MTKKRLGKYRPSTGEVERYIDICTNDDKFITHDAILSEKFINKVPGNTKLEEVLVKVALLNDFYFTNIRDTYGMAKHIIEIPDIDSRIQKGDYSVVNEIAVIRYPDPEEGEREWCHYSFATKYCSFHNPDKFPIYDSYVAQVLHGFNKRDGFGRFKRIEDLRDYRTFIDAIVDFRKNYNLTLFDFKATDLYLWRFGKDVFEKQEKYMDNNFKYRSTFVNKQLSELAIIGLSDTTQTVVCAKQDLASFVPNRLLTTSAARRDQLVEIRSLSNAINMEELIVPAEIKLIAKSACRRLPNLKKVVIEGKDTVIEEDAFADCQMLTEVEIPDESLRYYPAFRGSPVHDNLIDAYRKQVDNIIVDDEHVIGYDECPIGSDYDEAFKGCDNIEFVHLRSNEHQMQIGNVTTMQSSVRDLSMAFFNCKSLRAVIIPEKVENMHGALMGCDSLTEIAILGHYNKDDVFGLQYTAEQVEKLLLFSPEPMLIGSTPNAVWYVPEGSVEAYKHAVENFNKSEGLLQGYIYYKDIKPLQKASKGLKSVEIHKLLIEKGYAPAPLFNIDMIDATIEREVSKNNKR